MNLKNEEIMSDQLCNRCLLEKMKQALKADERIEIITVKANPRSSRRTGCDVYRVKEGQQPGTANWVCWFMELSIECKC